MKLHLPKLLLTALLTAVCASASHADDSTTTSSSSLTLGDVMYVGDSITHGVNSASYRWPLHKIFVDNGVRYTEVGYTKGNHTDDNGKDDFDPSSTNSYRGVVFHNIHSAAASQRAYNTAGRTDTERLNHTSIQNWLGVSTVDTIDPAKTMNNAAYSGSVNKPDTFVLMLGTNDLLSDPPNTTDYISDPAKLTTVMNALLGEDCKSGDMGTIVDTMYKANADATVYVSTIPCWANHTNNNADATREAVYTYNDALKNWADNYNSKNKTNIVVMDVNRGLVDVTKSSFYGVSGMFNAADGHSFDEGDMLHPNAQGDLIIAGNMARAMGIAGRTAGAERKAAEDFNFHSGTSTVTTGYFSWLSTLNEAGFTAELQGFTLGNGATDGWNTTDNFSFSMGNGSIAGTLDINEAYIQWGDTILFSENMSALSENIRMAYITGDSANGINTGFYVWLGDMLIGEALEGTSSTLNKVELAYSGTSTYTIGVLAMDSTGAYAPTSELFHLISAPAATAQGVVTIPDGVSVGKGDTSEANKLFANKGAYSGDVWCQVSSGQYSAWTGAHTSGTLTGNVTMIFDGAYKGTGTAFGIVGQDKVTGNVTLQFDAADAVYGSWTTSTTDYASVVGSYSGEIGGTFKAVINAGTFQYDILGGSFNGSSVGGTDIYINGGSVGRNVYGGSQKGTVGSTSVTITGGYVKGEVYGGGRGNDTSNKITGSTSVTITGGTIGGNIYAGGSGGTIKGDTSLTIDGNLPTLHGKLLSAGGSAGTIEGNASLTIKNATANNYIASIDKFTGTLSGGENVGGSSTLVFENTQLSDTAFDAVTVEHFDTVNLTQGSNITLGATALDGSNGSTISLTDNSLLTVEGNFSSAAGLNITGGSGSVTLAGQTNSFGGAISVAAGNTLTLSGDLAFNIEDGDFDISYTYDTTRTTNGLGNVTVKVSGLEHLLTGEGSFNTTAVDNVTVNGSVVDINALASESASYTKENAVYYVMNSTPRKAPVNPLSSREAVVYSLGDGTEILMSEVVHVGKHNYSGPAATEDANGAQGFYVGENGVLCIMGDSDTMLAGDILETTQGSGKIFLRSPGYTDSTADAQATTLTVQVDSATQSTGSLYLAPYELNHSAAPVGQPGVYLHLGDGANVSSLSEINYGYPQSQIMIDGLIESNTEGIHINSINAMGCGTVFFAVNQWANDKIQLGNVNITSYEHGNGGIQPGRLFIDVNHLSSNVVIHHLEGGETEVGVKTGSNGVATATPELYFSTGQLDNYGSKAETISGILDIESFSYRGTIQMFKSLALHKLHININLKEEQWLNDFQYSRFPDNINSTLTIKGSGTYILSEGNSIKDNFGLLSTEYAEDGVTRIWTGTVEVNNLDASGAVSQIQGIKIADYGNENSTIHFKGFKGYLTDNATAVEIKSALILENTDAMNGYEITGGDANQVQTYTGDIRGTGDFVVSAGTAMVFNLQGDLSDWKDGAELKVTGGTQAVNFSKNATVVNADIAVESEATLNMSVGSTNAAHTTTFNGNVKASSLTTYSETEAHFAGAKTKIGNVDISTREQSQAAPAVIKGGMNMTGNSITGGEASDATLTFDNNGTLTNAKLTNISLCSLQAAASIKMENIAANQVYLAGQANFESLDTQVNFKHTGIIKAFDKQYNEVYFQSDSFSGMTLDQSLQGHIILSVKDSIDTWANALADAPTNVTIFLDGFTVEGLTLGKRMEGMFDPLQFNIMSDNTQIATLSESTAMTVSQLLGDDSSYQEIYYVQQADGLLIRMSNIPEPTTATLSLLALTALAARRRRQK